MVISQRRFLVGLFVALLVWAGGCKRRPSVIPAKIFVPPPPTAHREAGPPPQLPPPAIELIARALLPEVPPEPPEAIRSEARVPPFPEPVRRPAAEAPAHRAPELRLGALLSPEEERRYRDRLEADLARVRRNLARLARRALTAGQAAELRRIRALTEQAKALRGRDPIAASELAGRAAILSEELLRTSR